MLDAGLMQNEDRPLKVSYARVGDGWSGLITHAIVIHFFYFIVYK